MHLPLKNLSIGVAALALFTGLPEAWQQKAPPPQRAGAGAAVSRPALRSRCFPASRSSG